MVRHIARRIPVPLILALLPLTSAAAPPGGFVWIEGEAAVRHNMRRHGWYDSVEKKSLSGGEWLSHFAPGAPPEAEYRFEAPRSGRYDFWIRCNTAAHPRLSYRLGGGPWREVDLSAALDVVNIATDGKPDMRFVGWVRAGKIELSRGAQTIRFRFHSDNRNHGALDCFLFTTRPFRPRGALKPGERSGLAQPGFFAWEPDVDSFGSDALVDLSGLNEEAAGRNGRVQARGKEFVLGDGRPVKFWAANAGPGIWRLDHESHVYLARRLAKCGVNMVRLHGAIYGARDPTVNRQRLDDLQHLVHALKNEGIYTYLSFFFPLWFQLDEGHRPFMLLFYDEEMQEIYYRWARALLTTASPYSKLPLGRDPAVAIVEIINEDSHFFWTFGKKSTTPERWGKLEKLFGAWARKRHGSFEKAYEAWGGVREKADDPSHGSLQLYGAWEMTAQGVRARPKRRARTGDQVRFLAENMRSFYEATIRRFRGDYGYAGLVSCGNWHVSDTAMLDAIERYGYTAGDVIDHHGYFDHGHSGEASSWSVRPGQEFTSRSALDLELANPLPYVETQGYPHIVSEIGWPLPNMYRAEYSFLASGYGCLQGLDGVFSFSIGSSGWDQHANKFALSTPVTLGSFPAAALIYRRGDVREGPIVVMDHLRLDDLFAMRGTAVHAGAAFDQFRASSIPPGREERGAVKGIDPLTFYVGRVVRSFDGRAQDSFRRSVEGSIDRKRRTVKSATGELVWDYGRRIVTMDSPRAQGAAGFLRAAGKVELDRVSIEMRNDYGTVTVVSLDGRPIADSERILVQCMTLEQFYGFQATGAGNLSGRIQSVGSGPCGVEKFDVVVTLKLTGGRPRSVVACDEHGYARGLKVKTSGGAGAFAITLDATSPYHVVMR